MKSRHLFILLLAGLILFVAGLLIPTEYPTLRYVFMAAGAGVVVVYYFFTLVRAIRTTSSSRSRRIFWTIAIICLPVIGNTIFIIFSEMADRKQKPGGLY